MRKDTSTLLALSAIALLTINSLVLPFNPLPLQPAQAQVSVTFQSSPKYVPFYFDPDVCGCFHYDYNFTFTAQGTASSDFKSANITGGTYHKRDYTINPPDIDDGSFSGGTFTNNSKGGKLTLPIAGEIPYDVVTTSCADSPGNFIYWTKKDTGGQIEFMGGVQCFRTGHEHRDSDGDGTPDPSDKCAHDSHPRCFREGDTSKTTTTHQQQPSSSRTGNQTGQ